MEFSSGKGQDKSFSAGRDVSVGSKAAFIQLTPEQKAEKKRVLEASKLAKVREYVNM